KPERHHRGRRTGAGQRDRSVRRAAADDDQAEIAGQESESTRVEGGDRTGAQRDTQCRGVDHRPVRARTRSSRSGSAREPFTTSTAPSGLTKAYAGWRVTPKLAQTAPSVSASWVNPLSRYFCTNAVIAGGSSFAPTPTNVTDGLAAAA